MFGYALYITHTKANSTCLLMAHSMDGVRDIFKKLKAQYNNMHGRPFSPDYLTKKFRKIIDKSERLDKRLHLHDLRVSCVSILMSKGIPIKDVQKWVGHADIQTTLNIYTRTTRKRQLATAQTMANVLF